MKKYFFKTTLLVAVSILLPVFTACNKDDGLELMNPINLNMLNEANGKTILGESGVYINKANNFTTKSRSALIADCGTQSGWGENIAPLTNNLAYEVAVTPGNYYQVFDKSSFREFSSGVTAVRLNDVYYQVFVESIIRDNDAITGAKVKYVGVNIKEDRLPKWRESLAVITDSPSPDIIFQLPKGAEYVFDASLKKSIEKGRVHVTVKDNNILFIDVEGTTWNGTYTIYVRLGNVFSCVQFEVDWR